MGTSGIPLNPVGWVQWASDWALGLGSLGLLGARGRRGEHKKSESAQLDTTFQLSPVKSTYTQSMSHAERARNRVASRADSVRRGPGRVFLGFARAHLHVQERASRDQRRRCFVISLAARQQSPTRAPHKPQASQELVSTTVYRASSLRFPRSSWRRTCLYIDKWTVFLKNRGIFGQISKK